MLNKMIASFGLMMLACCAPSAPAGAITVENALISAPVTGGEVAAAYFVLQNKGAADQLVGASTTIATAVELHETMNDAGMMRMHHLPSVELPAGGAVEFAPGGKHIMLIGLKTDLVDRSQQPITLTFAQAAPITVMFTVTAPQ